MTDEELDVRLRRFQVAGPRATLQSRVLRAARYREIRRDLCLGSGLAFSAAALALLVAWQSVEPPEERLKAALSDPVLGEEIAFRIEFVGGGASATGNALATLAERREVVFPASSAEGFDSGSSLP